MAFKHLVVAEFGRGHAGQRRLVFQRGSHAGVVGEALEGDQFGVCQNPEQIGDGVAIGRVGHQVDPRLRRVGGQVDWRLRKVGGQVDWRLRLVAHDPEQ